MSRKSRGILCIILSAFFFALMNIMVRLAGDLPSPEKSFFRNFVAFFFALYMVRKEKISLRYQRGEIKALVLRSLFGTFGILGNFYAIDHMLVADASMLNKLSPFFVIIFSALLLKERAKAMQLFFVGIAFVGTLFILKPGFSGISPLPALMGVMGGMCAGIAYTFVRKLGTMGVKGPLIVLFFSAFSCLATLPFLLADFKPMSGQQLFFLIMAGLAASGGQFAITAAYTSAPAREVSIYDYTQIIFATVLSFLILNQIPDKYSFLGYLIILLASLSMFFYNNRKDR